MDSTFWDAVAAIAAVIALAGGGVSWWQANASKAAKADAVHAKDLAERQAAAAEDQAKAAGEQAATAVQQVAHLEGMLAEAREQSDSLGRIAEATAPRPLEVVHVQGILYRLRNNTSTDMVIEQIDNRDRFQRLDYLEAGTELRAHESVEFRAGGSMGMPVPSTLVLGMVGEDRPFAVEIPPKPPKA
ncbi:hypothetical protein M4D54_09220 [Brachybacterium sp. p3-SID1565]|uniref:Uncharacterized protein n=1 Tax=Brachybacterium epidermidis TaxID=2781983 RepID=A0ABR9W467_9MICO|nr:MULTISPECIES: hypothetical protein [Brachybacterium]MBE9405232.1 hypothetical protein [Brachybacterium epidermidis]MCT1385803.1 hypothetical protein [Brachybacterium sp. p3-SID1565]